MLETVCHPVFLPLHSIKHNGFNGHGTHGLFLVCLVTKLKGRTSSKFLTACHDCLAWAIVIIGSLPKTKRSKSVLEKSIKQLIPATFPVGTKQNLHVHLFEAYTLLKMKPEMFTFDIQPSERTFLPVRTNDSWPCGLVRQKSNRMGLVSLVKPLLTHIRNVASAGQLFQKVASSATASTISK